MLFSDAVANDDMVRACRKILADVIHVEPAAGKTGRLLCFDGGHAAAAAKVARPLELRCVAARVDAGLYTRLDAQVRAE